MLNCIRYNKCNWCNKKKPEVVKIKLNCKWYNFNICNLCYNNKMNKGDNQHPISKPFIKYC